MALRSGRLIRLEKWKTHEIFVITFCWLDMENLHEKSLPIVLLPEISIPNMNVLLVFYATTFPSTEHIT